MAATKTRVTCPHCGRSIALVRDGAIARHGRHHRPACPGAGLTAVDGPLTDRQLEFLRYCWETGDALPVVRLLNVTYAAPDIAESVGVDRADDVLTLLVDHGREWIARVVQDYQQGVAA